MQVILMSDLWLHRSQSGAEAVSTRQHSLCKAVTTTPIGYTVLGSAPPWASRFPEGQNIKHLVTICPPGSQLLLVWADIL